MGGLVVFAALMCLGCVALGLFYIIKAPQLSAKHPNAKHQSVKDYRGAGTLSIVLGILLSVCLIVVCEFTGQSLFDPSTYYSQSGTNYGIDEYDAWNAATDVVKDNLKAPSTAEFCNKSDATITQKGDTWTIRGYVDAENSFGAKLRNDFTVVITFTNSTRYTINECTITAR